jgi:hypothetical protein
VAAIAALPPSTLILDGEVCIFDHQLISRFEWLRHGKPPGEATPPIFMVFDCLHAAGRDLRELALCARREWLEDVIHGQDVILPARRLAPNGLEAWAEVLGRGYARARGMARRGDEMIVGGQSRPSPPFISKAIGRHILARAELIGRYKRK